MFLGTFEPKLDEKGRFTLPATFRETLKERTGTHEVYLTRGLDHCIFAFDSEQFERIVASFEAASFAREATRKFQRTFFASAARVACDGMGRLRVPEKLQKYAGLTKNLVVAGTSSRFEIWDLEAWEARDAEDAQEYESVAEQLFP